jgi:hypothetical protein
MTNTDKIYLSSSSNVNLLGFVENVKWSDSIKVSKYSKEIFPPKRQV